MRTFHPHPHQQSDVTLPSGGLAGTQAGRLASRGQATGSVMNLGNGRQAGHFSRTQHMSPKSRVGTKRYGCVCGRHSWQAGSMVKMDTHHTRTSSKQFNRMAMAWPQMADRDSIFTRRVSRRANGGSRFFGKRSVASDTRYPAGEPTRDQRHSSPLRFF